MRQQHGAAAAAGVVVVVIGLVHVVGHQRLLRPTATHAAAAAAAAPDGMAVSKWSSRCHSQWSGVLCSERKRTMPMSCSWCDSVF
jgi:hypothetical protein